MKQYIIQPYHPAEKERWNELISKSRNGSFLFDRNFMDYHRDRFEDASLMVYEGTDLKAVLPACRVDSSLISHQGLSYGGLIYQNLSLADIIEIMRALLEYLYNNNTEKLIIKLIPTIYQSRSAQDIAYTLFLADATLMRRDTLSVVRPPEGMNMSTLRKRGLKKAVALGLEVREEQDFTQFWNNILIPNLESRHRVAPVHSLAEISLLHSRFPDNIRQFNVYDGDDLVAGTTIFENPAVAHAQYISVNSARDRGALDLLFNQLIGNVFLHKRYFDFGISNEASGRFLNKGLSDWKQSFGADTYLQDCYEVPTANHTKLQNIFL